MSYSECLVSYCLIPRELSPIPRDVSLLPRQVSAHTFPVSSIGSRGIDPYLGRNRRCVARYRPISREISVMLREVLPDTSSGLILGQNSDRPWDCAAASWSRNWPRGISLDPRATMWGVVTW